MISVALLWFSMAALCVACLAATAVHAFRDFSRAHLRESLRRRGLVLRCEEIIEHYPQAALGAESIRVFATGAAVFAAAGYLWNSPNEQLGWPLALTFTMIRLIGGALVLWVAIVWLPTAAARIWAEAIIGRTWPLWKLSGKLFAPSMAGTQMMQRALHRLSGKTPPEHTERELEEEIREVVTEGEREGLIQEEAREMIESVMALGEVSVSEIMTPRTDMYMISAELAWDEALQIVTKSGHTRIPVYGDRRDEIIGILHIKDMLGEMVHRPAGPRPLVELLRPPFFVPETKPVDGLLQEFQRTRNHIAVVVDEFGGVSGLVTIEDALEEIVGEIADEHDEAAGDGIKQIDEHSCEALARVHLSELNEKLGLHLPEDEHFDTIGGFIFHQLGRIPHIGEELIHDNVKFKVLEAVRRRIIRVGIKVLAATDDASPKQTESSSEGVKG